MMMDTMGGSMWIAALIGVLLAVVLLLTAAALIKYLLARNGPANERHD